MTIPSTSRRSAASNHGASLRSRWRIVEATGRVDLLGGLLAVLAGFAYVALGAYNRRVIPSNPQGLCFIVLVEVGRACDALGLDWLVGDVHRRRDIALFMSPGFVRWYTTAAAALHLLIGGMALTLGRGLIRRRPWARVGQGGLLMAFALAAPFALQAVGAAIAVAAIAVVALPRIAPGAGPADEGGDDPATPRWVGSRPSLLLVGVLALVLIPAAALVTEWGLVRAGISIHRLFS